MVLTINNLCYKIISFIVKYCVSGVYKYNFRINHDRQTLMPFAQNSTGNTKNRDYFALVFLLNFKFKII